MSRFAVELVVGGPIGAVAGEQGSHHTGPGKEIKEINDKIINAKSNTASVLNQPGFHNNVVAGVPLEAQALIWDVFFASRGRGLDIHTHFPWIDDSRNVHCITVTERGCGELVATLVLRGSVSDKIGRYAMIGMVCVDELWRRLGLSRQLMETALSFAAEQHINSLLLWTEQPSVYRRYGFLPDNRDGFGSVALNPLRPPSRITFVRRHADAARGLPPFGRGLTRFESDAAEVIGVETAKGVTLAEWRGPMPSVLDLVESALPATWRLNTSVGAPIFDEISKRGHFYTALPGATRMVRHLYKPVDVPYVSVLDRI